MRNKSSRRAFTLVELMLVLLILAVLAGVVLPRLIGRGEDAKKKAAIAAISNIKSALTIFNMDNGRFPTTGEGLQALIEAPPNLKTWAAGGYLEGNNVPVDPWGNQYQYRCPGTLSRDGYDLYSYGPDGAEGGDDDIGNWQQ